MSDASQDRPNEDVEQLRADIAETRREMGETVQELEEELDPRNVAGRQKARVQQRLDEVKQRGTELFQTTRQEVVERGKELPWVPIGGGAAGLAAVSGLGAVAQRRRRSRILERQRQEDRSLAVAGALGVVSAAVALARLVGPRQASAEHMAVRDIMTPRPATLQPSDTLLDAARRMRELDVGALPVVARSGRVHGIVTDRDIATGAVAKSSDLGAVTVGRLAGSPVTISPNASTSAALRKMARHKVRRLPVVRRRKLVGMLSQADIATHIDDRQVGELVDSIAAAP